MFDHFDFLAPIYDRFISFQDHARLKELLKLPATGWILDAGGGTGRVSSQLSAFADHVIVTDLSHNMLKKAQQKGGLNPIRSHVESLPFPDESFERILVVDAFHHFCDQQEAAIDLLRVLKTGGRLVIEEPDIHHVAVKLVALAEKILFMRSHFYSSEQIEQIFLRHRVRVAVEDDNHFICWIIVDK